MDDQPQRQDDRRAAGAAKWWRWEPHAGRWMPSEPPMGKVDAASWRMCDSPPTIPGPRLLRDGGQEAPAPRVAADAPLSSSAAS